MMETAPIEGEHMRNALWLALTLAMGGCDSRTPVGPDWTPNRLLAELEARGEQWECQPATPFGIVCKRVGDPLTWEQLQEEFLAERHDRWGTMPGRLAIIVNPVAEGADGYGEPTILRLGQLVLTGHPDELSRVRALFR